MWRCYLTQQKEFQGCKEFEVFEVADNPGLSGWTQHNHKGSWKKGEGGSEWEKGMMKKANVWNDSRRGHRARNVSGF